MIAEQPSPDVSPPDVGALEPDQLGTVAMMLHGREDAQEPAHEERRSFAPEPRLPLSGR